MDRNEEIDVEKQLEEAPPMPHARRRKLKKRKRDEQKRESDEDDFPAKTKLRVDEEETNASSPTTENVPARLYNVWVGNMSFIKTRPSDLRTFFKDLEGEITCITMPRQDGGEKGPNKGSFVDRFAYVDFATAESKETAISYSERLLHGRKLLIKDDPDWQGSHSVATLRDPSTNKPFIMTKTSKSILANQYQPPSPILWVGNLPVGTTIETIRDHLESNLVFTGKNDEDEGKGEKKALDDDTSSSSSESEGEETREDMPKKRKGNGKEPGILTLEPQDDHGISDSDSSSEDEELAMANEEGENEEAGKPSPLKPVLSPKEALGLRAIRLGAFKNRGECRGWAFLDFDSAAHATAALIRLPNHYLFNRKLELHFASIDATRRGGYVEDPENPGQYVYDFQGVPSKNERKSSKRKDKRLGPSKKKRAQTRREERAREKSRL